jgi:hypothetical protein
MRVWMFTRLLMWMCLSMCIAASLPTTPPKLIVGSSMLARDMLLSSTTVTSDPQIKAGMRKRMIATLVRLLGINIKQTERSCSLPEGRLVGHRHSFSLDEVEYFSVPIRSAPPPTPKIQVQMFRRTG